MRGKDRGEAFWRQNPNLHTSLHKSPAINQTHPIRNNVGMVTCLLCQHGGGGSGEDRGYLHRRLIKLLPTLDYEIFFILFHFRGWGV